MGNKTNLSFFNAYLELDKACAKKLDIKRNGVSEYIGRLVDLRFAPERGEVLPKLIQYRKIRNVLAHEEGALSELSEITKSDIQWITKFTKSVGKGSDPVSLYEKKAKRYAIWRKAKIVIIAVASALV